MTSRDNPSLCLSFSRSVSLLSCHAMGIIFSLFFGSFFNFFLLIFSPSKEVSAYTPNVFLVLCSFIPRPKVRIGPNNEVFIIDVYLF